MNWKKKFLFRAYTLFENQNEIGRISPNSISSKFDCLLNNNQFIFKQVGFMAPKFIVSSQIDNQFAEIQLNYFRTKALITLHTGVQHIWKVEKFYGHFWRISQNNKQDIQYLETFCRGEISGELTDEFLILAGLIIKVYVKRILIIGGLSLIFLYGLYTAQLR